jgi:hypothetical protein
VKIKIPLPCAEKTVFSPVRPAEIFAQTFHKKVIKKLQQTDTNNVYYSKLE